MNLSFFDKILKMTVLVLLALGPGACGYTNKTVLPHNFKTIYVDTVKNGILIEQVYAYQPGVEIAITNGVIRRLERDGNLKVVPREQADAVLEMVMIRFEQEGLRFSKLESVQEFRLFIVLAMRLLDNRTGDIIWEEPSFSGDADYFVSTVRDQALADGTAKAIDRLARNVVDRIVEDW